MQTGDAACANVDCNLQQGQGACLSTMVGSGWQTSCVCKQPFFGDRCQNCKHF